MRSGALKRRTGKAVAWLLAGLLVGGGVGAGTMWMIKRKKTTVGGDANLAKADELNMVPADATGFVHIRLADLWKSDAMEEYRKVVEKAGPQALAALDDGFVPAPSSVDRITVVFIPTPQSSPQALALIGLSARLDAAAFRESHMPGATEQKVGGNKMWADGNLAAVFPKDKVLVVGTTAAVTAWCATAPAADGPLAPALKEAAGGTRHVLAAINLKALPLPPQAFAGLPGDFGPLLKAESVSLGMALTTDAKVELRAVYANDQDAKEAERAVKSAAELGRKQLTEPIAEMEALVKGPVGGPRPRPIEDLPKAVGGLVGLGAAKTLDDFLANPPVKRNGGELTVTVHLPPVAGAYLGVMGAGAGLMLPAVDKVREAAGRASGANNLKQFGLAMHSYHDANLGLPQTQWGLKVVDGKPTGNLSWRVAILPYIEEDALYREFKFDEPWDSDHNKKLIPRMPKVFECPRAPAGPGLTYYKVFTAAPKAQFKTMFDRTEKRTFASVLDGLSNTIMVVEGGDPVTWTKPDDIVYDPKGPLPKLSLAGNDTIQVCLGDGSTRTINLKAMSEKTLRAAITANDGEVFGKDW
jgi:hypothetical protein